MNIKHGWLVLSTNLLDHRDSHQIQSSRRRIYLIKRCQRWKEEKSEVTKLSKGVVLDQVVVDIDLEGG